VSDHLFVTLVKLNELCGRAVQYRRKQLAEIGVEPIDLRYNVRFSVPIRDLKRRPDGWVHIANLMDDITGGSSGTSSGSRRRIGCESTGRGSGALASQKMDLAQKPLTAIELFALSVLPTEDSSRRFKFPQN
jgi:hypothetical protein